jgi:hypothetical protein
VTSLPVMFDNAAAHVNRVHVVYGGGQVIFVVISLRLTRPRKTVGFFLIIVTCVVDVCRNSIV